jgi:peroxiredoxin
MQIGSGTRRTGEGTALVTGPVRATCGWESFVEDVIPQTRGTAPPSAIAVCACAANIGPGPSCALCSLRTLPVAIPPNSAGVTEQVDLGEWSPYNTGIHMLLHTKDAEFGTQAPLFALPDLEGETITLHDALGSKGLVVAFICNHCPYVKAMVSELVSDANTLSAIGVNVVGIMSNDYRTYPADAPSKMVEFATQHAMSFPYLLDDSQEVAKAYGAVCTPDFFGYDGEGLLRYRGRLDNGGVQRPSRRVPELLNAMKLVTETGEGPAEQNPSIGCSIKWR